MKTLRVKRARIPMPYVEMVIVGVGLLALAGMAAAILMAAGCATVPPPPGALPGAPRLYEVAPGIYRSAQPTEANFALLRRKYGLRAVVKLNSGLEGLDLAPEGVVVYADEWLPAGPVDHDEVASALADLERAPKPVLIHCTHGEDRTGLLVGLYRVFVEHEAPKAAWAEMLRFSFHPAFIGLERAFERETGWHP